MSKGSGKSPSTEGFYVDSDGVRRDAEFHDAILDNPEADRATQDLSRACLAKEGWGEAQLDILYGKKVV